MQLRSKYRPSRTFLLSKYTIKFILLVTSILVVIFFLGQLELPAPQKLIKQEISNDKFIKLK